MTCYWNKWVFRCSGKSTIILNRLWHRLFNFHCYVVPIICCFQVPCWTTSGELWTACVRFSLRQLWNCHTDDFRKHKQAKCRCMRIFEHQSSTKQKFLFVDDFCTSVLHFATGNYTKMLVFEFRSLRLKQYDKAEFKYTNEKFHQLRGNLSFKELGKQSLFVLA